MMGYISSLREKVGHDPIIHAAASVIVENEKGQILLQKRTDNGTWSYAGGAVELFERTEDTAKRELFEETGLIADELTLFGVFSGEELHYTYPNGDEVSTIDILYICRKYHGELRADGDEVSELRFFDIQELPELSPPVRMPMEEYKAHKGRNANVTT
ncbi:MAG: NUDIX hydrolase [Oscillospiraceae bacterium]|nr:NUDIX hydrolase [Oscillospiraceae bacterium]MBR4345520.1 NUDIX hydrolase [Oscillospiraceae bacterium]